LKQCGGSSYRNHNNECVKCADGCTLNDEFKVCECDDNVQTVEEACDSSCQAAVPTMYYDGTNFCIDYPTLGVTNCTIITTGLRIAIDS